MAVDTSPPHNTIRSYALLATAVSSLFSMGISIALIFILSSFDWCDQAIGVAADAGVRAQPAIDACFSLMGEQVDALSTALLISIGVNALCLLTLVVIVLAGGRLSFKANKTGVEGNLSSASDVTAAALATASAAQDKAEEIAHDQAAPAEATSGRIRPDDPDGDK